MILITGGLGFLGSYIASYLVSQKQKVVLTSHRRTEPLPFLKEAVASGQAQVVPCDVANRDEVLRTVSDYKITSIIHAAHRPSYEKPRNSTASPIITLSAT